MRSLISSRSPETSTTSPSSIWQREFRGLRLPYLFDLRTDPNEQATITSNNYGDWYFDRSFAMVPLPDIVGEFLATFVDFRPRQKAVSFTIDKALEMLQKPHGGK